MSDDSPMIDISGLTKPGTVLIKRLSDAVGGMFRPWQIERVAEAEAKAEKIKAKADLDIEAMQSEARTERAVRRFVAEEIQKQENIERIGGQAALYLKEDANPEDVEEDWIFNFLDKCRLTSDEEMQELWARVLSSEANEPGSYSKRTVDMMASMDKRDAEAFTDLCSFTISTASSRRDGEEHIPLIYDWRAPIYLESNVNYAELLHLSDIGLIRMEAESGIEAVMDSNSVVLDYFGTEIHLELPPLSNRALKIGKVDFSVVGMEIFSICTPTPKERFIDYLQSIWRLQGVAVEVDE